MKIVHIILGKANPNRMNGVNKVVNSLATTQSKLNHEVEVWGISASLEKNYPDRNYTTKIFLSKKNKFCLDKSLKKELKQAKNTVFHLHGGFIPVFYSIHKILKNNNQKYIFTPHGAYNKVALQKNRYIKNIYFFLFEQQIIKNAFQIHCIGKSEADNTKRLIPNAPILLLPNGQDMEELSFAHKPLRSDKGVVFGFCGRIDIHTKGLDLLLTAFANYLKSSIGMLWIIGGDGEMEKLTAMVEKMGVAKNIIFWGKQFGEEKLNIMSQADAFFLPSRNEGLPGVFLEASGLAVPCVVSMESNVADYVKKYNSGIVLSKNDSENIHKAMCLIDEKIKNKEIETMKQNAKKMVEQEFSWQEIAIGLYGVYEKALM